MPITTIIWVGPGFDGFLYDNLESMQICITQFTHEYDGPIEVAAMYWPTTAPRRNVAFTVREVPYLAVYRDNYILIFGDAVLNIEFLIEILDHQPRDIREMEFWDTLAEEVEYFFHNN